MNFNNKGYSTQGYISEIPLVVQLMISSMLHKRIKEKKEVDYLQVFKLSRERNEQGVICQKIVHKQEQPPMEDVSYLVTDEAVNETVFCIDDESHHTFLLSRVRDTSGVKVTPCIKGSFPQSSAAICASNTAWPASRLIRRIGS